MNHPLRGHPPRLPFGARADRHVRADTPVSAALPTLPVSLQPYVTLVENGNRWAIRVAQSHEFDSGFLSWIDTLNHHGVAHDIVRVDLADLLEQRRPHTTPDAALIPRVREIIHFLQLVFTVGATDVHWQLTRDALLTQVRIDGHLHDAAAWTKTQHDGQEILRATMSLAHNKPSEYRSWEFQGAQIDGRVIPDTEIDNIRVFRGPADPITFGGEFMKLRLQTPHRDSEGQRRSGIDPAAAAKLLGLREPLRPSERKGGSRRSVGQADRHDAGGTARSRFEIATDALVGFDETQLALAVRILAGKGLVFSTGPTGAGKTHAAASCDDLSRGDGAVPPPDLARGPTRETAAMGRHARRLARVSIRSLSCRNRRCGWTWISCRLARSATRIRRTRP
ncbi:MAG: hypothetical protein VB138_02650 [Burkholderia sp.]